MRITERRKLLIYKLLLFVFAFVLAFMPSTASRNLEVNSRVIVEMLGIDGADEIELTAQYVMPTDTPDATTKDKVTVKAKSITEAVEALNTALGRRAELGQCSVIVAGKDIKPDVLGTLMNATDVTANVYLTAASDKASDAVGDITEFMKKTGATEADFIAYSTKQAHVATVTILNFLSDLGSASKTAYMPIIEMIKEEGGSGGGQSGGGQSGGSDGQSGGGGSGEQKKEPVGMKVEKLALYNNDGRVGELESSAARGVAWISAPIENGVVVSKVKYKGDEYDVSARLLDKSVSIDVLPKKNRAVINLTATVQPNCDKFNVLEAKKDKKTKAAIKAGFSEAIKKEMKAAYEDSLALGLDPLFVGQQFYRFEPDFFEKGYELGNTKVVFNVNVLLK
ncbi:MAG: hypothetical protein J1G38_02545 [Clostridiales bacterium]|nr:hypothetical protein [Clostridiales bacterium]